jgi:uncharacterized protein YkwD
MKILATILIFIFTTIVSIAQTSLDRKVFDEVNKYRASIHIPKLEWDSCAYKAANFQSNYLKVGDTLSHKNSKKGYESSSDRYKMFGGIPRQTEISDGVYYQSVGEIANRIVTKDYPAPAENSKEMEETIAAIAIVDVWKGSVDHKKIMTGKKFNFAGCSVTGYKIEYKEVSKWNKEKQIFEKKKVYLLTGISVMVLVN